MTDTMSFPFSLFFSLCAFTLLAFLFLGAYLTFLLAELRRDVKRWILATRTDQTLAEMATPSVVDDADDWETGVVGPPPLNKIRSVYADDLNYEKRRLEKEMKDA